MIINMLPLFNDSLFHAAQRALDDSLQIANTYEIVDTDSEFRISLDVPGMKCSDLSVTVDDKYIHVSGTRQMPINGQGKDVESSYYKSFAVDSQAIDLTNVKAHLSEGVLKITALKKPKAPPTTISVLTDSKTVSDAEAALNDDNMFAFSLDVPGIKPTDISVVYHEGLVQVNGTRRLSQKDEHTPKKARYANTIEVDPSTVDVSKLIACASNGVLTVVGPKKPKPEPTCINVSANPHNPSHFAETTDKDNEYRIYMDVPGVKASDISVKIDMNNVLQISGSRRLPGIADNKANKKTRFFRTFAIDPEQVEINQIQANLADGVLIISAPKKALQKPRSIEIIDGTNSNPAKEGADTEENDGSEKEAMQVETVKENEEPKQQ